METGSQKRIDLVSWLVFIAAVALAVFFQVVLFLNIGGFWRDEASGIWLAKIPSFYEMFSSLYKESFPALFYYLLHVWIKIGLGTTESGMRLFTFVVFFSITGSLLWAGRLTKCSPPILALSLVVFNPVFFYVGSSLRAYGLAAVFIILTFGFVWKVASQPTAFDIAMAALFAVLSVQSNYHNSYLLFSICTGGITVCLVNNLRRRAAVIAGVGCVAALTLLPYLQIFKRAAEYNETLIFPLGLDNIWTGFSASFGSGGFTTMLVWIDLVILILILAIYQCRLYKQNGLTGDRFLLSIFSSIVVSLSFLTFVIFIRHLGRPATSWYFIPLMAVCAIAVDSALNPANRNRLLSAGKIAVACLVIFCSAAPMWEASHMRMTNMDIVANYLNTNASADDLIVVSPFWLNNSFMHYYHGGAPWILAPYIKTENASFPLAEIKHLEASPQDALEPVFNMVESTLKRGGRVWFALAKGSFLQGISGASLLPGPHPLYGWNSVAYGTLWRNAVAVFLKTHTAGLQRIPIASDRQVSPNEDMSCYVAEGWRDVK